MGLGGFPLVTLAEARDMAFENRRLARRGGDPFADRRRANVPTFRQAAERTYAANRPRWRNAKHIASWMQMLEKRALPAIGEMRVDQIAREDVLRILTPIWTRHRRLRGRPASVSERCSPGRRRMGTPNTTRWGRASTAPCPSCRSRSATIGHCPIRRSRRRWRPLRRPGHRWRRSSAFGSWC